MNHNKLQMGRRPAIAYIYWITIFMLALTGFAQMPIFKRYYIADIPGLGWLAAFYVTHYLHYLFAILLLTVISYILTNYLLLKEWQKKISQSGYVRMMILVGLIITGILLVIRNLSGTIFSPGFIIVLNICHAALVIALLIAGLLCMIFRKKWVES
ncbi:MAG: hypothetical protein ABIK15_19520 [Pseudomonadota bacterium]